MRLSEVCNGDFDGIDERDSSPFLGNFRGISIRIHVGSRGCCSLEPTHHCHKLPGYPSSTEVERRLKELTGTSRTAKGEKLRARSMQVREVKGEQDYPVANGYRIGLHPELQG